MGALPKLLFPFFLQLLLVAKDSQLHAPLPSSFSVLFQRIADGNCISQEVMQLVIDGYGATNIAGSLESEERVIISSVVCSMDHDQDWSVYGTTSFLNPFSLSSPACHSLP